MLTNATVKAARAKSRPYKLFDERGLHLLVRPSGRMSWRVRYRWEGREQLLTIGCYPDMGLNDARQACQVAHEDLARGRRPQRSALAPVMIFSAAAHEWLELRRPGWTATHAAEVEASLARDVFPAIGADPLDRITSPMILELLRTVERRGAGETARRLRQRISDVFALAISEGWATEDPAAVVGRALKPIRARARMSALTDVAELRELLAAADRVQAAPAVMRASTFLALTAVRLAAVRGARWDEIEDLDGPAPIWRVPAARMKLAAAKKRDAANDHIVPLSPAAVAVLRAARSKADQEARGPENCGNWRGGLIFPGKRSNTAISEGAIGALYIAAGYRGRHVAHGWRASFSTVMNETMPAAREVIDRALGHALKSADGKVATVEGAYNRAQLLDQRRVVLDRWAELILGVASE
ncbi:tyrosine-type recombinase/integrase [uncultured Sphingomonas sp.]|uniref:tyrosine-type recombinase/integrase n=1 Tax=uncultured Sphingomonas sp. TaxID=158754 RepID=UPI00374941F3